MNFSLPFQLTEPGMLMILAAFGAIAGLYFFFHGFSLLQQRRPLGETTLSQRPAHPAAMTSTTFTTRDSDSLKPDTHHEVIHLSPAETEQLDSASMTQQGKIAAALLKAGIPNPVTLPDTRPQAGIRLADPSSNEEPPNFQLTTDEVAHVLHKSATAPDIALPSLKDDPLTPSPWKANLMIWGGPILTLGCIYLLAAHLGWL